MSVDHRQFSVINRRVIVLQSELTLFMNFLTVIIVLQLEKKSPLGIVEWYSKKRFKRPMLISYPLANDNISCEFS